MSLRIKFILALLLTSLASVGLVGGVAYMEFLHKFNARVQTHIFNRFENDVVAYVRSYGSWEQAKRHESFRRFTLRRNRAGAGFGDGFNQRPPPRLMGATRPQRAPRRPIFRFVLFDSAGKALLPTPPYRVGEIVQARDKRNATPILLGGRVIAYASNHGLPSLSRADRDYLRAMRTALAYGVLSAAALALLLGVLFGNTLSRALRQLTQAIQSMGEGSLRQRVDIKSRDEVGLLAVALNRMSEDLTQSHEELERSNHTISRQAARLEEMSNRDFLTDLYNRRYFDEQATRLFTQATRYRHPLSLMIGDIDSFKAINDRFSHAIGDAVLKQVANILQENIRGTDLLARYGGEEFVIAFPETSLQKAVALAEKLRAFIETHDWTETHPDLKVTISMGVGSNDGVASMDAMLQAADLQLYQAKQNGRNRVCYT